MVLPRGKPVKNLPREVNLARASTASELYQQLATSAGTSVHRLRVTKGSDGQLIPNSKDVSISQTGLMGDSKIYVKDLGMPSSISSKQQLMVTLFRPTGCMADGVHSRISWTSSHPSRHICPTTVPLQIPYLLRIPSSLHSSDSFPYPNMYPLRQTGTGDIVCPPFLCSNHACHEYIQELGPLLVACRS